MRWPAFDALFGIGSFSGMRIADDSRTFFARSMEQLMSAAEGPIFRSFTMRVLMLDATSVGGASFHDLRSCFCGARLYVWFPSIPWTRF